MANQDPRSYETIITVSTGGTLLVRESAADVVRRFSVARDEGVAGLLSLTDGKGQPVYLIVGHVVVIAPRAPEPEPLSPEMMEGLQRPSVWGESQ